MRRLLLPLFALIAVSGGEARASDVAVPMVAAPASGELFVELVVNGEPKSALAALVEDHGRLSIDPQALRDAGVLVTGDRRIDLASPPGFRATYDAAGQRLLLDVPPALLPTRRISGGAPAHLATSIDRGALLNYDLYVQIGDGRTTAALLTEQRVFGPLGTLSNTGVLRSGFAGRNGYLRYDTRFSHVFEDQATELNAGDLITRALPWTSSVRMGGVQLARNFAVRPDLVTAPLPRFAGEARLPSGVDLFVNGFRQATAQVQPGRFVLDDVPVVNGAGEARVVTTDAVGRQIATVIPFYVAPDLLRPGLTDFAIEAGVLRRGYGVSNLGYRTAALSASARRGMTDRITLSAHVEATPRLIGGGAGVAWRAGLLGQVYGAVAGSRTPAQIGARSGMQVTAGYTYDGRRFSIGAEHTSRTRGYTDLGGFDLARLPGSRRSDRVSGSMIVGGFGSIGVGVIDTRSGDGFRARLASASASVPIGRRASAFAAIDYDLARGRVSAQFRLIVPLGNGGTVASGGVSRDPSGTTRFSASAARATPTDGGFGYSADAAVDDRGRAIGQASATWRGRRVELEAGAATTGSTRSAWAGASGSVVLLDGGVFAARNLPSAFALVATGAPGVPVSYENQRLGVTDRRGRLFVPSVTAYHPSRFAIDPVALPIGMVAPEIERRAALRPGTGAVIRLPVRMMRSVTIHLVDAAGVPFAPGTEAATPAGDPLSIGYDGVVMIEQPDQVRTLSVRTAEGSCTARVPVTSAASIFADVGTVRCE